jgi:hypothetical protein
MVSVIKMYLMRDNIGRNMIRQTGHKIYADAKEPNSVKQIAGPPSDNLETGN